MDELISFRKENLKEQRKYIRSVHRLTRELAELPEAAREDELAARREEIDELANKIKKTSRKAWRQPATFALGLTGAFWKYHGHDDVGALFGLAAAFLGLKAAETVNTCAYSYLFRANSRFP